MDVDGFWGLIGQSATAATNRDDRLQWLTDRLAGLPPAEIEQFQIHLDRVRARADTWHMWGAAYLICDGLCSDDGFWYFLAWLVGLGRDRFEQVVGDPDALAHAPEVRRLAGRNIATWSDDEWPEWESLDYVAEAAYENATGDDTGLERALLAWGYESPATPEPVDDRWDFDDPREAAARLPVLSRMFPRTARER
jgi:hypothetical protein